jgi:2-haloacid dehalogenase
VAASRAAAVVFDAYGTLFDVHSVTALADELWPGHGVRLSQLWRAKQLEYTWLRSLMQRYEDFGAVTADALRYTCEALGLAYSDAAHQALMHRYLRLDPFPEVRETLARLAGRELAILSNGSPATLAPLVAHAGLAAAIPHVLSVHDVGVFKPDPRVYQLAVDHLGAPPEAIAFVSSNCWDALGAKSFGFSVCWVNRGGAPADRLGFEPDAIISSLAELPPLLA